MLQQNHKNLSSYKPPRGTPHVSIMHYYLLVVIIVLVSYGRHATQQTKCVSHTGSAMETAQRWSPVYCPRVIHWILWSY